MNYGNEFMIELKELIERYETALSEDKNIYLDADQLADIANWYINENEASKALKVIDYGLQLHPSNTKILLEKILLFIDNRNFQKAKEVIESFPEPNLTELKLFKAEVYLNEGKLNEADFIINSIDFDDDIDSDLINCVMRL